MLWSAPSSSRDRGSNRGSAPSSSRDRGANPPGDRRECGRPPSSCRNSITARTLFRASVLWWAASSSRYRGVNPADKIPYRGVNPAHKIPPRVAIAGSTPPRVVIVVPAPPRVAIVVSIQRIRSLTVRGATKLLSVLWYKPGVRLPPRVANVVQTPGETLAGKWVDVSISIW